MKSPHFLVSVTLALLAVSGIASVESDLDRNLKTIAAAADKELPLHYANLLEKETLVRLWADKPEYLMTMKSPPKLARAPRLVSSPSPEYPAQLLEANVRASVLVSFIIDATGKVADARVMHTSDARFNAAAINAVLQWKFRPALREDGQPAVVASRIPIEFSGT